MSVSGMMLGIVFCFVFISHGITAPATEKRDPESTPLVPNDNTTGQSLQTAALDNGDVSNADGDNVAYDDEDLYDITIGDVIRDVIITLRNHPEVLKILIEEERAKIANRIAAITAENSVGEELAVNQNLSSEETGDATYEEDSDEAVNPEMFDSDEDPSSVEKIEEADDISRPSQSVSPGPGYSPEVDLQRFSSAANALSKLRERAGGATLQNKSKDALIRLLHRTASTGYAGNQVAQ